MLISEEWVFEFKQLTLNNKYFLEKTTEIPGKVVNGLSQPSQKKTTIEIINSTELKSLTEEQQSEYKQLTQEKLEEYIIPTLEKYYNKYEIPVSIWKSNPNYLIQDGISLKDFAEKPSKYPPLRNIFALAGYKPQEEIIAKVNEIEKKSNYRRRLEHQLSKETTDYLNWAEHKILIDVEITDELNIHVKVQDKDNLSAFHNMSERSQNK